MSWTFDHLAFNTADGQALQDDFAKLLGLNPGRRPPFPFPGRWLYQDEHAVVHVMEEKQKAKIAAQRASFLFENVALEWHVEMSRRWTEGHAKTVLSRLRPHVVPLIGQRPIAELDTHDLLEVTQRIKDRGTMDAALRVQNYLIQPIYRVALSSAIY